MNPRLPKHLPGVFSDDQYFVFGIFTTVEVHASGLHGVNSCKCVFFGIVHTYVARVLTPYDVALSVDVDGAG